MAREQWLRYMSGFWWLMLIEESNRTKVLGETIAVPWSHRNRDLQTRTPSEKRWAAPLLATPWTSRWCSSLRATGTCDIAIGRRCRRDSCTERCAGSSYQTHETLKEGLYRIQILCRRHPFWSYPAGLTKAEVSPSVCTPLSPILFTPQQILYSPALMFSNSRHVARKLHPAPIEKRFHHCCVFHTSSGDSIEFRKKKHRTFNQWISTQA